MYENERDEPISGRSRVRLSSDLKPPFGYVTGNRPVVSAPHICPELWADVLGFRAILASRERDAAVELHNAVRRRADAVVASTVRVSRTDVARIGYGMARPSIPQLRLQDNQSERLRAIATRKLPAVYLGNDFVEAGALISFGPNKTAYRRADEVIE